MIKLHSPKFIKKLSQKKYHKRRLILLIVLLVSILLLLGLIIVSYQNGTGGLLKPIIDRNNAENSTDKAQTEEGQNGSAESGNTGGTTDATPGGGNTGSTETTSPPETTYSFSFLSGFYTPVAYPNYPTSGRTSMGKISGTLNAQTYSSLSLTWGKQIPPSPSLTLQGSYNALTWTSLDVHTAQLTGSKTYSVNYPFYRAFSSLGDCAGTSPCTSPSLTGLYYINVSAVLTK